MSTLRKLFALLLCITVICGCLASCEIDKPRADKYEASVRVAFATDDDKMKLAVGTMNSFSVIKADGDNISVLTTAYSGDAAVTNSYTLTDGRLYHHLKLQSGAYSVDKRQVAELNETYEFMLLSDIGMGADIDRGDFGDVTETEADGVKTYTCSGIIDSARDGLQKTLSKKFDALGADVNVKNVNYLLETKDSLEIKATLSCDLEITLEGEIYEVTMRTYTEYNYEAEINISAPSDADAYKEVTYEEIMG